MAKKKTTTRKRRANPLPYIIEGLRSLAVPLETIKEDSRNARKHSTANIDSIAASLERFGQRKPVVVNRTTGKLEAGHGTLEAAKKLGWTHLAVVWVKDDAAAARDFGLADNRTAELAEWDRAILDDLLLEIQADDPNELFDALLLGELQADLPQAGNEDAVELKPEWGIVIDCETENEQKELLVEMDKRGMKCRALL